MMEKNFHVGKAIKIALSFCVYQQRDIGIYEDNWHCKT